MLICQLFVFFKYNKVLIVFNVLSVSMKKILGVKLEPGGEERLLITEPILRQIDSNGRIFVSKDYVGKDALLLLAYPTDNDLKRFNPVKKRKVETYDSYAIQKHDLREAALASAAEFVRNAFHTVFDEAQFEQPAPEKLDVEIFNSAVDYAIADIIDTEGSPYFLSEEDIKSFINDLTDTNSDFIKNMVDDIKEVDDKEWDRLSSLFYKAYNIVAYECLDDEEGEE